MTPEAREQHAGLEEVLPLGERDLEEVLPVEDPERPMLEAEAAVQGGGTTTETPARQAFQTSSNHDESKGVERAASLPLPAALLVTPNDTAKIRLAAAASEDMVGGRWM